MIGMKIVFLSNKSILYYGQQFPNVIKMIKVKYTVHWISIV